MSPIKSFDDFTQSNEIVYLDANVLITSFSSYSNNSNKNEVTNIVRKMISNDTLFVTSTMTCNEIASGIRSTLINGIRNRMNNGKIKPRTYISSKIILSNNPNIYADVQNIKNQIITDFRNLPSEFIPYIGDYRLSDLEMQLSIQASIDTFDALHLIAAKSIKVPHFFTCDKDFLTINDPAITIYLPQQVIKDYGNNIPVTANINIPTWTPK